jgi:polyphosphate kinase 2 (PPK2 family)
MNGNWWIENKYSGWGEYVFGKTFKQACQQAIDHCTTDTAKWCVFDGENKKVAEVTKNGVQWRAIGYGEE